MYCSSRSEIREEPVIILAVPYWLTCVKENFDFSDSAAHARRAFVRF